MAYEKSIQELDRLRNQKDMELNFEPRLTDIAAQISLFENAKKEAINSCTTIEELKETEDAIRLAEFENKSSRTKVKDKQQKAELKEKLLPVIQSDHEDARNEYEKLSQEYSTKLAEGQAKIQKLVDKTMAELNPIVEELSKIERASDYLFNSQGVEPQMRGVREFIEVDLDSIGRMPVERLDKPITGKGPKTIGELFPEAKPRFSDVEKPKRSLFKKIMMGDL